MFPQGPRLGYKRRRGTALGDTVNWHLPGEPLPDRDPKTVTSSDRPRCARIARPTLRHRPTNTIKRLSRKGVPVPTTINRCVSARRRYHRQNLLKVVNCDQTDSYGRICQAKTI